MNDDLGTVLKELREQRGLKQVQVADKVGAAPEYISMLESGARVNPSADVLAGLATALGTTPDYILGRIGIIEVNSTRPIEPLVRRLDNILSSWPETRLKSNARDMVSVVVETLERIRNMDEQ